MRVTRSTMGMPVTVEIVDPNVTDEMIDQAFTYFQYVDETFSPFKDTSEVSRFNRGELTPTTVSENFQTILRLAEQTKRQSHGFFDMGTPPHCNPSGIVKGWAIFNVAEQLKAAGWKNFYVDAGGDIQAHGLSSDGKLWRVGIRNPFNLKENVKIITPGEHGVATSGTYERGQHIYNPHNPAKHIEEIVSLTVIGPNVYDADRFATAAFAMGAKGIHFIEQLPGYDGYMIDRAGVATATSNFHTYVVT